MGTSFTFFKSKVSVLPGPPRTLQKSDGSRIRRESRVLAGPAVASTVSAETYSQWSTDFACSVSGLGIPVPRAETTIDGVALILHLDESYPMQ